MGALRVLSTGFSVLWRTSSQCRASRTAAGSVRHERGPLGSGIRARLKAIAERPVHPLRSAVAQMNGTADRLSRIMTHLRELV